MMKIHLFADDYADAIQKTCKQYPHLQIGAVYLDPAWGKNHRWCIEVSSTNNGDAAEAARRLSEYNQYLRDTGDAA
jgi:hypothetical protein